MASNGTITPAKDTPSLRDLESDDDDAFMRHILATWQPPSSKTPETDGGSSSASTSAWYFAKEKNTLDWDAPVGAIFGPAGLMYVAWPQRTHPASNHNTPARSIAIDNSTPKSSCRKRHRSGLMVREANLKARMAQAAEQHPNDDPRPRKKRRGPRRGHRSITSRNKITETTVQSPLTPVSEPSEGSATVGGTKGMVKGKEKEHVSTSGASTPVDSAAKQNTVPRRQSKRRRLSATEVGSSTRDTILESSKSAQVKTSTPARGKRARNDQSATTRDPTNITSRRPKRNSKVAKSTNSEQEPNLTTEPVTTQNACTDSPPDLTSLRPGNTDPATPKPKKPRSPTKSPFFPSASIPSKSKERLSSRAYTPIPPLSASSFGIVQERLAAEPFKLLVAVQFLNKTKGSAAVPVFYELIRRYPTPEALATADHDEVVDLIRHLGLQDQRARRIIALAQKWLTDPPEKNKRYRTLHYPLPASGTDIKPLETLEDNTTDPRDGAFEVAHLPGSGAYALDSWRIFCRDALRGATDGAGSSPDDPGFEPEWKRVVPLDKELRVYLRWKWLREGWFWDPLTGNKERASEQMMRAASEGQLVWETWDLEGSVKVRNAAGQVEKLGSKVEKTGEVWDGVNVGVDVGGSVDTGDPGEIPTPRHSGRKRKTRSD